MSQRVEIPGPWIPCLCLFHFPLDYQQIIRSFTRPDYELSGVRASSTRLLIHRHDPDVNFANVPPISGSCAAAWQRMNRRALRFAERRDGLLGWRLAEYRASMIGTPSSRAMPIFLGIVVLLLSGVQFVVGLTGIGLGPRSCHCKCTKIHEKSHLTRRNTNQSRSGEQLEKT